MLQIYPPWMEYESLLGSSTKLNANLWQEPRLRRRLICEKLFLRGITGLGLRLGPLAQLSD
jgi:hypothetical protein